MGEPGLASEALQNKIKAIITKERQYIRRWGPKIISLPGSGLMERRMLLDNLYHLKMK